MKTDAEYEAEAKADEQRFQDETLARATASQVERMNDFRSIAEDGKVLAGGITRTGHLIVVYKRAKTNKVYRYLIGKRGGREFVRSEPAGSLPLEFFTD